MKTENVKVFFRYSENGTITAVARSLITNEDIISRKVKLRHGDVSNKIVGKNTLLKS